MSFWVACFCFGGCIWGSNLCCLEQTINGWTWEIQFCWRVRFDVDDGRGCFLVGIARKGVSIDSVLSRLLAQSNNNVESKNKNELNRIVNCEH